jgi:poly-beta-hydroxybutyrate-responsive repressor
MQRTDAFAGFKPSGDMLTAHLLALLQGWTAYGDDLVQRLEDAGYGDYNKGSIYRTLRQMERMGLVASDWDTSTDGPARRMYTVTQGGLLFLKDWLTLVDAHRKDMETLLGMSTRPIEQPDTHRSPSS